MKIRHEVTVGAMTILGIVFMILGYNYLKGNDVFSRTSIFKINFKNTTGLYKANSVVINGLEVGRVKDIALANDGVNTVIVSIALPERMQIPDDSKFTIENLDLLGKKAVSIKVGESKNSLERDVIYQGESIDDLFSAINDQITPIAEKTDRLLSSLDTMINDVHLAIGKGENSALKQTMNSVTEALHHANQVLSDISGVFANEKGNIENIIQNADSIMLSMKVITANIASNNENIDSILSNFTALSGKLAEADIEKIINSAKSTLEEISTLLATINEGKGTLGKLVKDENLYFSIDSTINSLNALLTDLKANPKRYVSFSLIERKNK